MSIKGEGNPDFTVTHDTTPVMSVTQVCACVCRTHWGPDIVRWSTTRLQIPNGEVCAPGSTQTHVHTHFSHVIFHVSGHFAADMGYHNMTGWSRLFQQGDITAHKEISLVCVCECLCPCASVSMPTLFTHVNTQKPHGRPLRAAAAVEYVIQMVCDCLCACIMTLTCVCVCVLSSLLVRINGTDVSLRGAYRESLTSLHLL